MYIYIEGKNLNEKRKIWKEREIKRERYEKRKRLKEKEVKRERDKKRKR